ncbi:MAG: hypothetical protein JWM56_392 [Candidatus Peribacteria bacterium]|nr:hypothetical protein [Candidatus Peribacteria bacterium]
MKIVQRVLFVSATAVALTGGAVALAASPSAVNLRSAGDYVLMAGAAITSTSTTTVTGNLGLSPGTAVTGFGPGVIAGVQHIGDTAAATAQGDLTTAYNDAAGRPADATLGTELGGTTIAPGVYVSASGTFEITGNVTLDAKGDPNAVFIFQTATTVVTASSSQVILAGGAQACNIFWQAGSSTTIGANSIFKGNILALASVTLNTGASVDGRVLARNGSITMQANTITKASCAAGSSSSSSVSSFASSVSSSSLSSSVSSSSSSKISSSSSSSKISSQSSASSRSSVSAIVACVKLKGAAKRKCTANVFATCRQQFSAKGNDYSQCLIKGIRPARPLSHR